VKAVVAAVLTLAALSAASTRVPAASRAARAVAADTTIVEVYATNAGLAFDPVEIRVKAGSTLKIRFVNESALTHNLVILKNEKDLDALGTASFDAAGTGFVPMQQKEKLLGWSPLATAGKTVEFTVTMPAAGDYLFVCFVDGHFNSMIGKLKVT
jgi:plastocyanin